MGMNADDTWGAAGSWPARPLAKKAEGLHKHGCAEDARCLLGLFGDLPMRLISALTVSMMLTLSGFYSAHAGVLADLKEEFGAISIPGNQYAVIFLNGTNKAWLWPAPILTRYNVTTGARNYFFSDNATGGTHAEINAITAAEAKIGSYQTMFGEAAQFAAIYSYLGPCPSCATSIVTFMHAHSLFGELGFTKQWSGMADIDAYAAMKILGTAGIHVLRVCDEAECPTFQTGFYNCVMRTGTVCKDCVDKPRHVAGWINQTMDKVNSRTQVSWSPYFNEIAGTTSAGFAARSTLLACLSQNNGYPVGGYVDIAAPTEYGDIFRAPPYWNALTGEMPVVHSHGGLVRPNQ